MNTGTAKGMVTMEEVQESTGKRDFWEASFLLERIPRI